MVSRVVWLAPALAALLLISSFGASDIGTPKDGSAGPTVKLGDILAKKVSKGSMVTTELVKVTRVDCPSCFSSSPTAMSFWVKDSAGKEVKTYWPKYSSFNAKKENWVPKVGWMVKVQGRVDWGDGAGAIDGKRWAESSHPGDSVRAYETSKFSNGKYVWVENVKLSNKSLKPDGDMTYSGKDASTGKGFLHIELSLPYRSGGGLRSPSSGETVDVYGMLWKDYVFGYWEIHPVRCWGHSECAPLTASYVDNIP
jgi:hypothetical protein